MYAHPCGRHWYSGKDNSEASHDSARASPAGFKGRPTKSPTHGFSVLSCERTTDHSPEKSVCAKAIPADSSTNPVITRKECVCLVLRMVPQLPLNGRQSPCTKQLTRLAGVYQTLRCMLTLNTTLGRLRPQRP